MKIFIWIDYYFRSVFSYIIKVFILNFKVALFSFLLGSYFTSISGSRVLRRQSWYRSRVHLNRHVVHARRRPADVRLFMENTGVSKKLVPTAGGDHVGAGRSILNRACHVGDGMPIALHRLAKCRGMPTIGHGILSP